MRQAKRGTVAMPSRYQLFDLTSPSFCGDVISHGFFSGGLTAGWKEGEGCLHPPHRDPSQDIVCLSVDRSFTWQPHSAKEAGKCGNLAVHVAVLSKKRKTDSEQTYHSIQMA